MIFVAKNTNDFRRQSIVQQFDHRFTIGFVVLNHSTFFNVLSSAPTNRLDISDKIARTIHHSSYASKLRQTHPLHLETTMQPNRLSYYMKVPDSLTQLDSAL